jgi:hypothetical protein
LDELLERETGGLHVYSHNLVKKKQPRPRAGKGKRRVIYKEWGTLEGFKALGILTAK